MPGASGARRWRACVPFAHGTPPVRRDTEIAVELSALIRRVALSRRPREEVAGLTGDRWLAWLESKVPGLGASARTALLDAPYARRCRFDVTRALAACEQWIRRA